MEDEQGTEHLGDELLGADTDYLEIAPEAPDTKVPDIAERKCQILTTNSKEGIFDTSNLYRCSTGSDHEWACVLILNWLLPWKSMLQP